MVSLEGGPIMTTWDQLKVDIHANYVAHDISPRALSLDFQLDGGRSQRVFVSYADDFMDEQWAQLDSPVGPLNRIDLIAALSLMEDAVAGGLCRLVLGGVEMLTVRHSVPLATLDWDDFDKPLRMVTAAADGFERELLGVDHN
jgi:hypothetical protein